MQLGHARKEGGFTLIELVVTMVVLVILAMAAQPSLRDFFDRYRLRGAGDALVSLVSNARAEAVKTDLDVSVAFTGTGATWCAGADAASPASGGNPAGAASGCNCTNTAQCLVSGQRAVVESSVFNGVTLTTSTSDFVFDSKLGTIVPLGTPAVTLTSPSGTYDVNVQMNALGQARLCTPSGRPTMAGVPSC
jgi:prepilin-type N-terminal cleavage/methylation domain-containing protein